MYLVNPYRFGMTLERAIAAAGLSANLRLALDAGDAASAGAIGDQKWRDTSGYGNAADFNIGLTGGAEASDPTFNGARGGKSINEYWSFDGGDLFKYDGANETWMQDLHKDGAIYTLLAVLQPAASGSTQFILGDDGGSSGIGITWSLSATTLRPTIQIRTGDSLALSILADGALPAGAWIAAALSINEPAGAGAGFFWQNGAYNQVSAVNTFNATYSAPSAGNASSSMEIGARGGGVGPLANGSRMAAFAAWEGAALSKTNLDALYELIRGRWGL